MRRLLETSLFTALSCAILISLFGLMRSEGAVSSGAGGEALVSLEAAAATVAEMVEEWERPPQVQAAQETGLPDAPDTPTPPPIPQIELTEAPRAEVALAALPPVERDVLEVDTQSAAPLPPPPALTRPDRSDAPVADTEAPPPAKPKPAPVLHSARQAQQTSAGRAEQRAAGTGGGAQAGAAGGSAASTQEAGRIAKLKNVWGARIRARLERYKRYPSGTRSTGRAVVRLMIGRDGKLISSSLFKSSGDPVLDQAALSAVLRAGRFPKAPNKLPDKKIAGTIAMDFAP